MSHEPSQPRTRGVFEGTHDVTLVPAPSAGVRTVTMLRIKNRSDDELTPEIFVRDERRGSHGTEFEELPVLPDVPLATGEMLQASGVVETLLPGQSLVGRLDGDPGSIDDQPSYMVAWTDGIAPVTTFDLAAYTVNGERKMQVTEANAHRNLFTSFADSTIVNTSAETNFTNGYTVPAGYLNKSGKRLRVATGGRLSTTSAPNMHFRLRLGSDLVFDAGAHATANNATDHRWALGMEIVTTAEGATGELTTVLTTWAQFRSAANIIKQSEALDLTAKAKLQTSGEWSVAHAANSIVQEYFIVDDAS